MAKLSPMFQQYLEIKQDNKDCLVLFRVGDFFEVFFEDAVTVSEALNIVLTHKQGGLEKPIPMAGVPHHALETYVARLIDQGFKVAIADQLNTPQEAKGKMLERGVTRI
ncbi:MAG: DNA mismatch repair protein MutS, partial [Firmicutes bacterium]|nr:DNA mismatch repair protein MutS [Bacillota bacterium]